MSDGATTSTAARGRDPVRGAAHGWPAPLMRNRRKTTGVVGLDEAISAELALLQDWFDVVPNVLIADEAGRPAAEAGPGLTDPRLRDGTVILGTGLIARELARDSAGASLIGVMAHEFAHIAQLRWKVAGPAWKLELHADYLAGAFLAWRARTGRLAVRPFAETLFDYGDWHFHRLSHHGMPLERVLALGAGYCAGHIGRLAARVGADDHVAAIPRDPRRSAVLHERLAFRRPSLLLLRN